AGGRTTGRPRERECCPHRPLPGCGARRRSATGASRPGPSRDGLVLLLDAPPSPATPGDAAAALGVGEPARQRRTGRRRPFLLVGVFGSGQRAQLVDLFGPELGNPARRLGARRRARLGCEQESQRRPDHHAEQERPEARALLAHSPASRSSGAATATGRGCACDWSGGRTKRSVTARVLVTRSCSNRKANVFSRSAAMAARTSAGKSHRRRLNGPIAFLRLL